jgi:hypothetical protein
MARQSPVEADEVAALEDAIQDARPRRYGIRDGIKNLRRFNAASRRQIMIRFNEDEKRDFVAPAPCGLFCHR